MASVRSPGTDIDDVPVLVWVATTLWVALGGWASAASLASATDDGALIIASAATGALLALVAGVGLWWRTSRPGWFVAGLVISAVLAPTSFAYIVNLLPLLIAAALLVWARRRRRLVTAPT